MINFDPVLDISNQHKFHHLGYASSSIDDEINSLSLLGYTQESDFFIDKIQGVRGCFFIGGGPRIELLENIPNSKTLTPWINQNIKIYHFAFLTSNMNNSLSFFKKQRARIIINSVPAVAFNDNLISFVMLRNKVLIELIEKK